MKEATMVPLEPPDTDAAVRSGKAIVSDKVMREIIYVNPTSKLDSGWCNVVGLRGGRQIVLEIIYHSTSL